MFTKRPPLDYEPVVGSLSKSGSAAVAETEWANPPAADVPGVGRDGESSPADNRAGSPASASSSKKKERWVATRGHAVTYLGLFLFTAVLYFRPYELIPALAGFSSIAFILAVFTIIVYVPSQLAAEGTLTVVPREVKLVLLLCLTGLLSIPLAISPGSAWETFNNIFIKAVVMFIIMVNVVRTEWRLWGLFLLALAVACFLSADAIKDYRLGNFAVEGYRVAGAIGGMFGNPNDMALYLITVVPIAGALMLAARGVFKKAIYAACALLIVGGNVVTFSRSGFLGMIATFGLMMWKLSRRNRPRILLLGVIGGIIFLAIAPGNYLGRLASIFDSSLDPMGSSSQRRQLLFRSLGTALANPVFGVGMGNFHIVSIRELVSHNSYTQVAAEMGMAALVIYVLFIFSPFKQLARIERETFGDKRRSQFYYLAIGLQASLVGYVICAFFASVAYQWYIYYLVGYSVCLRRIYQSTVGGPESAAPRTPSPPTTTAADSPL